MSDLNTLNNKELREKCLQYGLPNVPVTDSSRKILIRKLHAAMGGEVAGKKPKSPKINSPANRRKTVNATITTTVSSGDEDDFHITTKRTTTAVPDRRRTTLGATTSANKTLSSMPPPQKIPVQRNIPINVDSPFATSTRIGNSNAFNNNNAYNNNNVDSTRQRRSISLTKTGVLTTSYNTEILPSKRTYEQDTPDGFEEQDDDLEDVEMESVADSENIYTKAIYNNTDYNNYNRASYKAPTAYESPNYYTPSYTAPATTPSPTQQKLYPDLNTADLQTNYFNSYDGIRASHSSSTASPSNLGYTHNPPTSYVPSNTSNNRQTISGAGSYGYGGSPLSSSPTLGSSATKRYTVGSNSTIRRHTARAIDDETGASSGDEQFEAPYLSKFSRNLETLKPDPILKRSPTATSGSSGRYSSYSPTGPKRRRATFEEDGISFSEFWQSLDEKYRLKQTFFIILCFVLAIFIYVFFLQGNP